ncbi:MAG: acyl-CoA dehydrogenase family protein [Thermodesulfobacteriota bacterium]
MDFTLSPVNKMVKKAAQDFCERIVPEIDAYMAEHDDYPPDLMEKFAKASMLGFDVPKEYGGLETSNLNLILLIEEFGKTASTCFLPLLMNNSVAETICHWGSEEVKKKFVPPLCDGSAWATMAFTEPDTGSDPKMLTTTAQPDGDDFIINGCKRFISMANKPGYGVFICKDLSLAGESQDSTAFIIDKSSDGISFSGHYDLTGLDGADTCDIYFNNVRVPKENILGKQGQGFNVLLRWISGERIQQAAGMVGVGQSAVEESKKYSLQRNVNGMPMGYMQGFYWMLGEMKVKVDACRLMVYNAVLRQDAGKNFDTASAEVKVFTTPLIQEVTRMGVQFHGSYGYSKEYLIEKLFRIAMHQGVVASSLEINKTIVGMTALMSK